MKKAVSLLLATCMFLCLLCSCGTASSTDKTDGENGESNGETGEDTTVDVNATAKELLGGYHYLSIDEGGDDTYTEEVITAIEWTANGAVMTGYEQQSDGDRFDMRMEVTFDDQKRPATLERITTDADGEVEENHMRFEYPAERTVKMINSGFGDGESYFIREYNEKGNILREEYPNYTYIYTYDDHGNCVSKKTDYVAEDQEDRESTTAYTYDADGKIVTAVEINTAGHETQTRYFYYPNGNVMMKLEITDSGDVNYNFLPYNPKDMMVWSQGKIASGGMEYTTDKDEYGRIVKVNFAGQSGAATTLSYDEQGRLSQVIDRHGDKRTYEYDSQNRLVKYTSVSDTSTSERVYTYDEQGRLVKEEDVSSGGYRYTTVRAYNEEGMVIRMIDEDVYPADEWNPQGKTSTDTLEITYVENAQCQVNGLWAELILMSLFGGMY